MLSGHMVSAIQPAALLRRLILTFPFWALLCTITVFVTIVSSKEGTLHERPQYGEPGVLSSCALSVSTNHHDCFSATQAIAFRRPAPSPLQLSAVQMH